MLAAVGCVLGFCKQVSEQPLQTLAGNVGGEEGPCGGIGHSPARQSSPAVVCRKMEMLKKLLSAMSV